MNIFETIRSTTKRVEPFHSQFLGDALEASLSGNRSLFDSVWRLATPPTWDAPLVARIKAEQNVGEGRVDICIVCEEPHKRVVGIEVKTLTASAKPGQLETYHRGLSSKFAGYDIQVAYLTPFNQERTGDITGSMRTVEVFDEFKTVCDSARHISWLDIADIPWDGNELWKQHELYVYQRVSSYRDLIVSQRRLNRGLSDFFGEEATERFRSVLDGLGIQLSESGTTFIDLEKFKDGPDFPSALADAFTILLDSEYVLRSYRQGNKFEDEQRHRFIGSRHGAVHEALFALESHPYVWIDGKDNYGVRTYIQSPRQSKRTSVSLVNSVGKDADRLEVGRPR